MWQDTAVALCQVAMVPSMLPTVLGEEKPALPTCVMNALIMTAITFTQATLGLWYSAATASLIIAIWATLVGQTLRRRQAHRPGAKGRDVQQVKRGGDT